MGIFDHTIGQDLAVSILRRALAGDAQHAYLFTGPIGVGKGDMALEFAAGLICTRGGCGECEACDRVRQGIHPDVEVVGPEGSLHQLYVKFTYLANADQRPFRPDHFHIRMDSLPHTVTCLTLPAAATRTDQSGGKLQGHVTLANTNRAGEEIGVLSVTRQCATKDGHGQILAYGVVKDPHGASVSGGEDSELLFHHHPDPLMDLLRRAFRFHCMDAMTMVGSQPAVSLIPGG